MPRRFIQQLGLDTDTGVIFDAVDEQPVASQLAHRGSFASRPLTGVPAGARAWFTDLDQEGVWRSGAADWYIPPINDGGIVWTPDPSYAGAGQNGDVVTAYLQSLIDAASAAYSVANGRVRLVFPPRIFMVNGLRWRGNVIYDWGKATFRKFRNSTGGDPLAFNSVLRAVRTELTTGNWYGQYDNIESNGGRFEQNGFTCGAGLVTIFEFRNSKIYGMEVVHSPSPAQANWGLTVAGRDIELDGCNIVGGEQVFQDGIHITYGNNISVRGGKSQSGDDAIALGMDIVSGFKYADEGLTNTRVTGVTVDSRRGYAVKLYFGVDLDAANAAAAGANRRRINGFEIDNITGRGGTFRNGGIAINEGSRYTVGPVVTPPGWVWFGDNSVIQNGSIKVNIDVGDATHDGSGAYGVQVETGRNIAIDASIRFTDPSGGTKYRPVFIQGGDAIFVNLVQGNQVGFASQIVPANQTVQSVPYIGTIDDVTIGGQVVCSSAGAGAAIHIVANNPIGTVTLAPTNVRSIGDAQYGVIAQGASTIRQLNLLNALFTKAAGATTSRAYAATTAAVQNLTIRGCDLSGVDIFSLGSFAANHVAYTIADNVGLRTRYTGLATIAAAATEAIVTHGAVIPMSGTAAVDLSQITVRPTAAPANAVSFSLQHLSTPAVTGFRIVASAVPGGAGWPFVWTLESGVKPS